MSWERVVPWLHARQEVIFFLTFVALASPWLLLIVLLIMLVFWGVSTKEMAERSLERYR